MPNNIDILDLPKSTKSENINIPVLNNPFGDSVFSNVEVSKGTSAKESPDYVKFNPRVGEDVFERRAKEQSWSDQLTNGVVKMGGLAATTFAESFTDILYGIPKALSTGSFSGIWNNPVNQKYDEFNQYLEQSFPNYRTHQEEGASFFKNMFSSGGAANFWGDVFLKNMGFTIGAIGAGMTVGGLLGSASKGLGATADIAKIAEDASKGINTLEKAQEAYKAGQMTAETLKSIETSVNYLKAANKINKGISMFTAANAESSIQARNATNSYREHAVNDFIFTNGRIPNSAELDDINNKVAALGNTTWALNMPLLLVSDGVQFNKAFSRGFLKDVEGVAQNRIISSTGKKLTNATEKELLEEAGWKVVEKSGLNKIGSYAKAIVANPLMEGFQEISQTGIDNTLKTYFDREKVKQPEVEKFVQAFVDGSLETLGSNSAWEEFTVGALTGLLGMPNVNGIRNKVQNRTGDKSVVSGGIWDDLHEINKREESTQKLATFLNQSQPEDLKKLQSYVKNHSSFLSHQEDYDKAISIGDQEGAKNNRAEDFTNHVTLHLENGTFDVLKSRIRSLREYDNADFKNSAGEKETSPNYNPAKQAQIIERLDRQADLVKKNWDAVNLRFSNVNNLELHDSVKTSQLKKVLVHSMTMAKDSQERMVSLGAKIAENSNFGISTNDIDKSMHLNTIVSDNVEKGIKNDEIEKERDEITEKIGSAIKSNVTLRTDITDYMRLAKRERVFKETADYLMKGITTNGLGKVLSHIDKQVDESVEEIKKRAKDVEEAEKAKKDIIERHSVSGDTIYKETIKKGKIQGKPIEVGKIPSGYRILDKKETIDKSFDIQRNVGNSGIDITNAPSEVNKTEIKPNTPSQDLAFDIQPYKEIFEDIFEIKVKPFMLTQGVIDALNSFTVKSFLSQLPATKEELNDFSPTLQFMVGDEMMTKKINTTEDLAQVLQILSENEENAIYYGTIEKYKNLEEIPPMEQGENTEDESKLFDKIYQDSIDRLDRSSQDTQSELDKLSGVEPSTIEDGVKKTIYGLLKESYNKVAWLARKAFINRETGVIKDATDEINIPSPVLDYDKDFTGKKVTLLYATSEDQIKIQDEKNNDVFVTPDYFINEAKTNHPDLSDEELIKRYSPIKIVDEDNNLLGFVHQRDWIDETKVYGNLDEDIEKLDNLRENIYKNKSMETTITKVSFGHLLRTIGGAKTIDEAFKNKDLEFNIGLDGRLTLSLPIGTREGVLRNVEAPVIVNKVSNDSYTNTLSEVVRLLLLKQSMLDESDKSLLSELGKLGKEKFIGRNDVLNSRTKDNHLISLFNNIMFNYNTKSLGDKSLMTHLMTIPETKFLSRYSTTDDGSRSTFEFGIGQTKGYTASIDNITGKIRLRTPSVDIKDATKKDILDFVDKFRELSKKGYHRIDKNALYTIHEYRLPVIKNGKVEIETYPSYKEYVKTISKTNFYGVEVELNGVKKEIYAIQQTIEFDTKGLENKKEIIDIPTKIDRPGGRANPKDVDKINKAAGIKEESFSKKFDDTSETSDKITLIEFDKLSEKDDVKNECKGKKSVSSQSKSKNFTIR